MTETPTVLHRIEDQVSIISLNRPRRHNALDYPTSQLLYQLIRQAIHEDDSRAILLRGEGRSFCSGRDTEVLGTRPTGLSDFAHVSRSQHNKVQLLDSQKPVVAAVQGYAIGGGLEMALRADIRVFADDAQISLPEIEHGVMTDGGGSVLAATLAGPSRAKYLIMTGERIAARQALEWGLTDFVVPREDLDVFALSVAKKIAAQPPVHLAMAKQIVDSMFGEGIRRGIREELLAITAVYRTRDAEEARSARREKRQPVFTGK
jgi:enoyl-CoA hydratase